MKIILTLLLLFSAISVRAYVLTQGNDKSYIRWPELSPNITFYINPANNDGISDAEVLSIVSSSAGEWNSNSGVNIGMIPTTVTGIDGRNEISFSSNSLYFSGTGVVGLTNVAFREQDGTILETDILLNDSVLFFGSSTLMTLAPSQNYLGNVLSHELGHAIGLGHSQVHSTTMFYKLYRGQHSLEHDDIAGAQAFYPTSTSGTITGKVVGSSQLIGVIGTHVEAVSAKTGKVLSSAITDENGFFQILSLPLDDQYFLYYKPLKVLDSLPGIYSDSRKDFCNSSSDYRGGFFQSCYNRDEGYPMGIDVTSTTTNVNVGNLSIQCGLKVPPDYFLSKNSIFELDIIDDFGNAGNTFVGFYTDSQINSNQEDEIHVDLTNYDVNSDDLYLDVKLVYQPFYSEMYLEMDVEFVSNPTQSFPESPVEYNSDKNPVLDLHERFVLNNIDNTENYFKFIIKPTSLLSFLSGYSSFPVPVRTDFFPELTTFGDNLHFYLMIVTISKKNLDGSFTTQSTRRYDLSDNSSCADGSLTYKVSANTYGQSGSSLRKLDQSDDLGLPVACGSINFIDRDPPSGGLRNGMLVGLVFSFLTLVLYRFRFDGP